MNLERFSVIVSGTAAFVYLLKEAVLGGRLVFPHVYLFTGSVVRKAGKLTENDVCGIIMLTMFFVWLVLKITGHMPPGHDYPECLQFNDCSIGGD